jgi:hypothetical protein
MQIGTDRHQAHIDGLRAVAVVAVLLFHLDVNLFKGGFVGVDVFFVISGFLITRLIRDEITRTGSFRFGNFYASRARRLAPALIAMLTLSTAAAALLLSTGGLKGYSGELIASLLTMSNVYFWREADYIRRLDEAQAAPAHLEPQRRGAVLPAVACAGRDRIHRTATNVRTLDLRDHRRSEPCGELPLQPRIRIQAGQPACGFFERQVDHILSPAFPRLRTRNRRDAAIRAAGNCATQMGR